MDGLLYCEDGLGYRNDAGIHKADTGLCSQAPVFVLTSLALGFAATAGRLHDEPV